MLVIAVEQWRWPKLDIKVTLWTTVLACISWAQRDWPLCDGQSITANVGSGSATAG
jgi:hypothetical protein